MFKNKLIRGFVIAVAFPLLFVTMAALAQHGYLNSSVAGAGCNATISVNPVDLHHVGLDAEQNRIAGTIVSVGRGLPLSEADIRSATIIGLMTGFGESSLRNLSHGDVAGPDSIGVFQQRSGWGTVAQRTDPAQASLLFFTLDHGSGAEGLLHIVGWQQLSKSLAANSVQHNSNPGYYAPFEDLATSLFNEASGIASTPISSSTQAASCVAGTVDANGVLYPTTDLQTCPVGTQDAGIVQTAKSNNIRLCKVSTQPLTGALVAPALIVNVTMAGHLNDLLTNPASTSYAFGGSGFHTLQSQIELRKAHCGSSDYEVYQKPASACSPPTDIPGSSQYEQGLAVDLTSHGRLITSQSDPAWAYLNAHASTYGLHNNASEPWYWYSLPDSSSGHVNINGYAWPVAPGTKSANGQMQLSGLSVLPCPSVTGCHHDGTPAVDLGVQPGGNAQVGTPEYAISNGVIDYVNDNYKGFSGCFSIGFTSSIDHFHYWYGHTQAPRVVAGQTVVAGQQIAEIGRTQCTGNLSTPHLHLDRGCVINGVPQPGGYVTCRDPGLIALINAMYAALPD